MKDFELIYKAANESIRPSADFKQRTLDRIFEDEQKKPRSGKKLMLLLVAAIIAISAFVGTVSAIEYYQEVRGKAKYEREDKMSIRTEYSDKTDLYTGKIEQWQMRQGLKLTLTEVLYEDNVFSVNFIGEYKGKPCSFMLCGYPTMYIDGEQESEFSSSGGGYNKDGRRFYTEEMTMKNDCLTGVHEITLIYDEVWVTGLGENGSEKEEIHAEFKFAFTVDITEISPEKTIYIIDETFVDEEGKGVYLDKVMCTPASQRLLYRIIAPNENDEDYSKRYYPMLTAIDPSKTCRFESDHSDNGNAVAYNKMPDDFDLNAEEIELIVVLTTHTPGDRPRTIKVTCVRQDGE